ncbi:MAG: excinuclease subunit [Fimbriimonadaceae bacterium]|nr:excinuclease subunit [Fimbriimonadaceae bacterium]
MPKKKARAVADRVLEKLKSLPAKPGCYVFHGAADEVLYVGKALSLRNRVRSYFQDSTRHGPRIERLVGKVQDIEWIVVDSELEALVLECNLIKKHRPPYNVRLRDDKSYPYIVITNEKFPRVMFTRQSKRRGGKYFGPYASAFSVRDTLQLLHKVFPLIPCGKSWTGEAVQRPCLYYHLGRCLGPCAGLADRNEYKAVISKVERFLLGKEEGIVQDLKKEMEKAAEELNFEAAAKVRDQVQALENVMQRQKVLVEKQIDQDVVAVVKDERGAAIQMLYIRAGKLIAQRQFILDGASEVPTGEAVQAFVKQYYADAPEVPREVLLPVEIAEREVVQAWLRQKRGSTVSVDVPRGGDRLRLVEMAASNAEQALATFATEMQQKELWAEQAMTQLQEELDLDEPPVRVECYDISNTQGMAPVGSMVVVENGAPAKDQYRRFKIRYHPESPNDFAMMHEVITRRLRAYVEGDEKFSRLPDLMVIDGGKGQLAAALKARDELGLSIPMTGLAKRMEILYRPIDCLPLEDPVRAVLPRDEDCIPITEDPGQEVLDLYRQIPIHEFLEDEPALNLSVGGPADQVDNGQVALHGSGAAAVSAEGVVGPRALPMEDDPAQVLNPEPPIQDPKSKAQSRKTRVERDAEYSYLRFPVKEYAFKDVVLPLNSPGLLLVRRLRDEAHRFALSYHRKLRDKRMHGSALEEIPGVGPRRKRLLLRTFGSVEGIRRATAEEIAAVPTMTKRLALQIKDYLQDA